MNRRRATWAAAAIWAIGSLVGCQASGPRTIIVPVGNPVILLEPVKIGRHLVKTQDGRWIEAKAGGQIPAGWACWHIDKADLER